MPMARSASTSTTARSSRRASGHPAACRAELRLFREVLGAKVVRESHIAAGDRCCSYRIEARPKTDGRATAGGSSRVGAEQAGRARLGRAS